MRPGRLVPLAFLAPALIIYTALHIVPFIGTLGLSLFDYNGLSAPAFIGVDNYQAMLRSADFWLSLRNNVAWFFGEVVLSTVISLVLALMINAKIRFKAFFRTTLFLPVILSWAVVGMLWSRIYNPLPSYGLLNAALTALGQPELARNWLGDASTVFPSVVVAAIWKGFGFSMVIFLAGLGNIPEELTEAAQIDGATSWQVLWNVTLPLLRPITSIVIILGLIGTFKVFDPIWVMTQGGPGNASSVLATLVFRAGLNDFDLGYSATVAVALLICTTIVMLIYMRFFGRARALED